MELKKIILIFLFISITSFSNAKVIEPKNFLTSFDVVRIQLNALKNNDKHYKDFGIKQVWLFAHPDNKKVTGPYEKFKTMIYGDQYKLLLNHESSKISLITNNLDTYVYRVEILTKDKKLFYYEWHVKKGNSDGCNDCWFTSAVSVPVNQGNTI